MKLAENSRDMLNSVLTLYSEENEIAGLLAKIDSKLAELGSTLYGNTVFLLNKPISAVAILDLLNYKRILTYRQVNPDYCSNMNMLTGEMIGDIIQWNRTNLVCRTAPSTFWFSRIIRNNISEDTTFDAILSAKSIITTISVYNLTANAFDLIVQTTDGLELLNEHIDASGFLTLTLNIPIPSLCGIVITSTDWNGAEIDISISTENPF